MTLIQKKNTWIIICLDIRSLVFNYYLYKMSIPVDTSSEEYDTFMTYIYGIYNPGNNKIYQYASASILMTKIDNYIASLVLFRDLYSIINNNTNAQTDLDSVNYTRTSIDGDYYSICSKLLINTTIFSIFIENAS